MDDQTKKLIQDFAKKLIKATPEFTELIEATKALEADPSSKQLWKDKEEQRLTIELLKTQGLPISIEQEQQFSLKLTEMRGNPITMRYLKAINFANKISGKIGAELFDLIGADFGIRRGCK